MSGFILHGTYTVTLVQDWVGWEIFAVICWESKGGAKDNS